ncbi:MULTISPECIES: nucleotidyltransferase domain-containing protein [unclassified Pantoea]|uniref:nucleotidyltransferase domain-containing protein n=1 Tax=unclassified Pantoea TaxID=2630326 RepID=UPI00301E3F78
MKLRKMAVDETGFISDPDGKNLQPQFSNMISDVAKALVISQADNIHSIYVYGSVAQGTAVETVSDLDITVIFSRERVGTESPTLTEVIRSLEEAHPVISKIDLDTGTLSTVMDPQQLNRWGYWLKHHCVCVYGQDLRERFAAFRPSREIAVAVNGDFFNVLNEYASQMKPPSEPAQRQRLQRAAARKAIRSTNILRDENDSDWPMTLEEHCAKFNDLYPALSEGMDYLLSISKRPRGDIMAFASRISTFVYWLNAEFSTRNR